MQQKEWFLNCESNVKTNDNLLKEFAVWEFACFAAMKGIFCKATSIQYVERERGSVHNRKKHNENEKISAQLIQFRENFLVKKNTHSTSETQQIFLSPIGVAILKIVSRIGQVFTNESLEYNLHLFAVNKYLYAILRIWFEPFEQNQLTKTSFLFFQRNLGILMVRFTDEIAADSVSEFQMLFKS